MPMLHKYIHIHFSRSFSSLKNQDSNNNIYELATSHTWRLLKLLMTTQDPHFSGFFSSVSLFQSSSSSRTSSSIGLPPSLATSALISASSSSRVCLVYFKEPNFSSNVTQYFFNSTSPVRCRSIPGWWSLRLIFKFSIMSQYPNNFPCNLELCTYSQTSGGTQIHIYSHLWSHHFFFLYVTHDQVLQLQNMHRHKIPLHYIPPQLSTVPHTTFSLICSLCSPLYILHILLWTLYETWNRLLSKINFILNTKINFIFH